MLGLTVLEKTIFKDHPYGHPSQGTVAGLKAITLDDVRSFYKQHYTRANLTVGLAGGYPQDYPAKLTAALAALPEGKKNARPLPAPAKVEGRRVTLVEKETGAVGIQFGYALPINRSHPDFYPLFVANNYLGDHRTFNGRLMQQLRGERGLNYGDYSYIEYWQAPPFTTDPNPGVPRRQQYFSVWIRPVVPADAQFALRAGLYEVERLRDHGLTKEEFDLTRDYLINRTKLWAQSQDDRLGFYMDSKFYGIPYFIDEIEKHLKTLTVEQVNAAVKKYIQTDNFVAVLVTDDAAALKATLEKDASSPKSYNSQVAEAVLEADKSIEGLKVKPASVDVLPVGQVFQK
jgi:zinc protease